MTAPSLRLETIVSRPFDENSLIVWREGRDDCLVIDPGLEPQPLIVAIERNGLTPAAILITHGHTDHIAGNGAIKERWPHCRLIIGRGDEAKLSDPRKNLSAQFGLPITSPPADETVADGETLNFAGCELLVREIPGHSIGHVVYIWRAGRPMVVFGGDVLFAGSVGRTDIPDGSFEQLSAGIKEKLFCLPDDTQVYPGHGRPTTIGDEKRDNPYVGGNLDG